MFKNTASQTVSLLVIDTATNLPKTGDAANLTLYVKIDGGSVTALTASPTEDSATNAPGIYTATLTQAETNGDKLNFTGKSSTSGVRVVPLVVYTVPQYFSTLGINSSGHVSTVTNVTNITSGTALTTDVTSARNTITALLPDVLVNGGIKAYTQQIATNAINANALNVTTDDFAAKLYTALVAAGIIEVADIPTVAAIADGVWDEVRSGHTTIGTFGEPLQTGATLTSLAPASTALSTATWTGTLATNLGTTNTTVATNLNATITSRMASYTQPTGFLAATFPTTVASTTNITAATGITVATNNDKTGYSLTATTGLGNQTANITGNLSGSVGSVSGAVGSVTGAVTVGTNNDKTGYSLTATTGLGNQTANITGNLSGSVGSVAGAVGSVTGNVGGNVTGSVGSISGVTFPTGFNTLTIAAIADGVWDETTVGHSTAGTTGAAIIAAGSAGDPWSTSLPGAYGAGTAGKIVGDNLNATVSSRMASYTQPTGFLAATFPTTVASPTNITAASGVAVSSIGANVITAASLAADAGTEIGAAVLSALGTGTWASAIPWNAAWDAEVQSECTDALNAYDPPTKAEMDAELDALPTAAEIRTEIDSNSTKLVSILDEANFCLTILAGTISDAQTAAESYAITRNGSTYTIDFTGLDSTGNRSGATLTKA